MVKDENKITYFSSTREKIINQQSNSYLEQGEKRSSAWHRIKINPLLAWHGIKQNNFILAKHNYIYQVCVCVSANTFFFLCVFTLHYQNRTKNIKSRNYLDEERGIHYLPNAALKYVLAGYWMNMKIRHLFGKG